MSGDFQSILACLHCCTGRQFKVGAASGYNAEHVHLRLHKTNSRWTLKWQLCLSNSNLSALWCGLQSVHSEWWDVRKECHHGRDPESVCGARPHPIQQPCAHTFSSPARNAQRLLSAVRHEPRVVSEVSAGILSYGADNLCELVQTKNQPGVSF